MDTRLRKTVCFGLALSAMVSIPSAIVVLVSPRTLERLFSNFAGSFFAGEFFGALYILLGFAIAFMTLRPLTEVSDVSGAEEISLSSKHLKRASSGAHFADVYAEDSNLDISERFASFREKHMAKISVARDVPTIQRGAARHTSDAVLSAPRYSPVRSSAQLQPLVSPEAPMTTFTAVPTFSGPINDDIRVDFSSEPEFFGTDMPLENNEVRRLKEEHNKKIDLIIKEEMEKIQLRPPLKRFKGLVMIEGETQPFAREKPSDKDSDKAPRHFASETAYAVGEA